MLICSRKSCSCSHSWMCFGWTCNYRIRSSTHMSRFPESDTWESQRASRLERSAPLGKAMDCCIISNTETSVIHEAGVSSCGKNSVRAHHWFTGLNNYTCAHAWNNHTLHRSNSQSDNMAKARTLKQCVQVQSTKNKVLITSHSCHKQHN